MLADVDPRLLAVAVINLVNLDGSRELSITPPAMVPACMRGLSEIDSCGRWRAWWEAATGSPLSFGPSQQLRGPLPIIPLPPRWQPGLALGINIGGYFFRAVAVSEGEIIGDTTKPMGSGSRSVLESGGIHSLFRLLRETLAFGQPKTVGIAWAAPRVDGAIQPLSMQSSASSEIVNMLRAKAFENEVAEVFGCPATSWNDGQAIVAAEGAFATSDRGPTNRLLLKLGTSIAVGIATPGGIVDLPLEGAKCILPALGALDDSADLHPTVALPDTVRSLVGAGSMAQAWSRRESGSPSTFDEFARAVEAGDDGANGVLRECGAAVAGLSQLVCSALGISAEVVLTGKTLESHQLRSRIIAAATDALQPGSDVASFAASKADLNLGAAFGAARLGQAQQPLASR